MAGQNNEHDSSAKKGADINDGIKEVNKGAEQSFHKDVQNDKGNPQSYEHAMNAVIKDKGPMSPDNPNYYTQQSEEFAKSLAKFMENPEQGLKTIAEQIKNVSTLCGAIETKIASVIKAQTAHEVLSGQRNA